MIPHVNLVVPKPYRNTMRHLYLKWTLRNLRPSFTQKRLTQEEMFTFFKHRYRVENFASTLIVDGAIDWYLTPLEHFEVYFCSLPNTKDISVLDLGCGAASVGHWLRKNDYKWSYLGVDMADTAGHYFKKLKDVNFLAKDVQEITLEDLPKKPDIIFAINLLCYIPEAENYLKQLTELGHEKTKLVLIDGYPAKFWNRTLPSKVYSTPEILEMLSKTGWRAEKTTKLGLFNVFNKPYLTISHGFICSRKA